MIKGMSMTAKKKYGLLILVEVILLIGFLCYLESRKTVHIEMTQGQFEIFRDGTFNRMGATIDDKNGNEQVASPMFPLGVGTYEVFVTYQTNTLNNLSWVQSQKSGYYNIESAKRQMENRDTTTSYTISVKYPTKDARVFFDLPERGTLQVVSVSVKTAKGSVWAGFSELLAWISLLDALLLFHFFWKKADVENRKTVLAIAGIAAFASFPLFTDFITIGHDLQFHLLRIDGIAQGLLSGQFPVKIQPNWMSENGYAVSVFYGDFLLYLPALLKLYGFSVQNAYKIYVIVINVLTTMIAYFSFYGITKRKTEAMVASAVYTLSAYRLIELYIRSALGEFSAMMFLPLIAYGLYQIYQDNVDQNSVDQNRIAWICLATGFAGLLQTHLLTTEMAGFFTVFLCLILWRKTFKKKVLLLFCKAGMVALLLSLGFLIPFLQYMRLPFVINDSLRLSERIQSRGVFPVQIFMLHGTEDAASMIAEQGTYKEMPLILGVSFAVILLLFLYLISKERNAVSKQSKMIFLLSLFALFLCTTLFPYDAICALSEKLIYVTTVIQFPWRFFTIASLLITVLFCFLVLDLYKTKTFVPYLPFFLSLLVVLTLTQGGFLLGEYLRTNQTWHVYQGSELNDRDLVGREYLPRETAVEDLTTKPQVTEGIKLLQYEKKYNTVTVEVEADQDGLLTIPLIYYFGYQIESKGVGPSTALEKTSNGTIQIRIPKGYQGIVQIYFEEPFLWRAGEFVSLLSLIGLIGYIALQRISFHANPKRGGHWIRVKRGIQEDTGR